jgi:hypothetical protein
MRLSSKPAPSNQETDNGQRYAARLREVRDFIEKVSWSAYLNSIHEKRRESSPQDDGSSKTWHLPAV